jgi:acetolactate synthase-1/3 small subunit
MSIVVDIDSTQRAQVIKQINKLVNVLQVSDLTEGSAVRRELVLLWVSTGPENRESVLKEAEMFGAKLVETAVDGFALEATGDPEKLDTFVRVMQRYGEIEVTRSGLVSVPLEAKKLKLAPPVRKEHLERDHEVLKTTE